MHAYQMTAIGSAEIRDIEEPVLKPGHVIIHTEAAGVCGTDLHVLNDGVYVDPDSDLPVVMGHEAVGRVTAVAADVTKFSIGDRVVVEPVLNCGTCANCLRGEVNLCEQWTHLGFTVDGVWAERFTAPVGRLTRISADVPAEVAALAEPLACSLHFLSRGGLTVGQSVVILGGGPSGQLALIAARAMGAATVIVSDPHAERRDLALQLGADAVIDARRDDVLTRVRELTGGQGADLVLEIAGSESSISSAFLLARPGGVVVLGGVCGQEELLINTQYMVRNEVTVHGAFATRWQMDNAVRLLERTDIDFEPIVGLKLHWHEAGQGLIEMAGRRDICKVVLMFDDVEAE
ncbi:MAG: zinc-dependent alcohol dehydrogenase [Leucobacter sp.]